MNKHLGVDGNGFAGCCEAAGIFCLVGKRQFHLTSLPTALQSHNDGELGGAEESWEE